MALSASTVWEVRTTGSDTNGGGFVAGASGTDHSQQDAAQYSVTDAVTNGTTTITSATASFGTDVVGNILYIQGGTGSITAGWYEITSRTSATAIVVDRSTGLTTGTGATLKIGGAFATPGHAAGVRVAQNWVYWKAGNYNITTSTANVAGGRIDDTVGGSQQNRVGLWVGYDTDRTPMNTDTNRPVFIATVTGISMVTLNATFGRFHNIVLDGNNQSTVNGMYYASGDTRYMACRRIHATRCVIGFNQPIGKLFGCTASDNSSHGFGGATHSQYFACAAWSNGGSGFNIANSGSASLHDCLAYDNTASGFVCEQGSFTYLSHCTAANNGTHGLDLALYTMLVVDIENCIFYGNGGWGIRTETASKSWLYVQSCAYGSNTSGAAGAAVVSENGAVTLTADPFTDAAGGDFSLNNAAGGGALLKGTGYPQTLPVT
jgi:hypothetical protein